MDLLKVRMPVCLLLRAHADSVCARSSTPRALVRPHSVTDSKADPLAHRPDQLLQVEQMYLARLKVPHLGSSHPPLHAAIL